MRPEEISRLSSGTVVEDYLHQLEYLKSDGEERHAQYEEIDDGLRGKLEDRQRSGIMMRTLSKLLPWYSDSDKDRAVVYANLLTPIIETKRATLGIIPSQRVPYPNYEQNVVEHSDRIEQAIAVMQHRGKWGRRCYENGEMLTTYGNSVAYAEPNLKTHNIDIKITAPKHFYCVTRDRDGLDMAVTYQINFMAGYEADAIWPGHGFDASPTRVVELIEVWDGDRHLWISPHTNAQDRGFVKGWTNPFGTVPVKMYRNRGTAGGIWGTSDVYEALEMHREYNRRQALEMEWILKTLYAPWVVKNPEKVSKRIPYGPGAVINVLDGGDVKPAAPANMGSYQWSSGKAETMNLIKFMTDTQDQSFGQMDSAIVTGKGFQSSMVYSNQRMEMRHQDHFPVHEELIKLQLELYRKAFPRRELEVYGWKAAGESYAYKIDPQELNATYDVEVYLQSTAFYDVSQKIILGLQMVTAGALPLEDFVQIVGWVPNATLAMEKVRAERKQQVEDAMALNQAMQAGLQSPNIDQAGRQNYRMEQGSMNQQPAPESAAGLPVGEAGVEMPGPMGLPAPGDTIEGQLEGDLENVADVIRAIPNLRGQVWLVGGILDGTMDPGDKLEIYESDGLDKSTILNALQTNETTKDFYGLVQFPDTPMAPPPGEQALEVTPGTSGYGDEEEPTDQGAPGGLSEDDQMIAALMAKQGM
jgi:hypothetical protein